MMHNKFENAKKYIIYFHYNTLEGYPIDTKIAKTMVTCY